MTAKKRVISPYWIIINIKKNSIWKKPYLTLEEAKKELNEQLSRNNYKPHDWVIEQREIFTEVDDVAGVLDEFSNF